MILVVRLGFAVLAVLSSAFGDEETDTSEGRFFNLDDVVLTLVDAATRAQV